MKQREFTAIRCTVPGMSAVFARTRQSFDRHIHDQFGIGLIDSGGHASSSGRGMVEAETGDVITVSPGEVHDGRPLGQDGRVWRMLYLDPDIVADVVRDVTEGKDRSREFINPVLKDPQLGRVFRNLFASVTASGTDGDPGAAEDCLHLAIARLIHEVPLNARSSGTPGSILVIKDLIDDDPVSAPALSELASHGGISRYQLIRGFARAVGLTPHAYRTQRRLLLARRLIASGATLCSAAIDSGFADQSHLTRAFSRSFGITPGAYARAMA